MTVHHELLIVIVILLFFKMKKIETITSHISYSQIYGVIAVRCLCATDGTYMRHT